LRQQKKGTAKNEALLATLETLVVYVAYVTLLRTRERNVALLEDFEARIDGASGGVGGGADGAAASGSKVRAEDLVRMCDAIIQVGSF
jgi:hypothetical protein